MSEGSSKSSLFERFVPILVLLSVALAFMVGVLWQKVANLEGGKTAVGVGDQQPAAPAGPKIGVEDLKGYAKDLGLDTDKFNSCLDEGKYAEAVGKDLKYGESLGVTGTPGFFVNGHKIDGAQPYQVFKDAIDFELKGGNWNTPPASIATKVAKEKINVDIGQAPVKGDGNAKVLLVEFSDFECPFCARFYSETLGQIQKEYIDTGKVKMVYKQFPLAFHPSAQKAAEASECANEQGKFWEMHDVIFSSHGY